jgi:4-oxalocrotonate tautomerase
MPFVHVHIAAGRPLEKRRRLAQAITDAVAQILEVEPAATQVLIHEHDRDNWAIGGELLSERHTAKPDDALPDLDALFKTPAPKPATRKPAAKARPKR